jgi:hypothetical protein
LLALQIVRCQWRNTDKKISVAIVCKTDRPLEEMLNFPVKGDIDPERLKPPPLFDNNDGQQPQPG